MAKPPSSRPAQAVEQEGRIVLTQVKRVSIGLAALGLLGVAQLPAQATHGNPDPWVPNDRFERVYFHCEGATKIHNSVSDGWIPWDTTAPTQSVEDGAGCGSVDNGLWGNNQISIQDAHFQGLFTGNLDKLTVEAHNIYLGPARQPGPFTVNVRLAIDGNSILGFSGRDVTVTPVRSASGASELIRFTLTGLDLMDRDNDIEHDVLLTLAGGQYVTTAGFPIRDSQSAWVYDTTEVPSGIAFNPKEVTGVTVPVNQ